MSRVKTSVSIDISAKHWLDTQPDLNLSDMINTVINEMMEQKSPADERALEDELSFHKSQIKKHREDIAAISVQLQQVRAERERERAEKLTEVLQAAEFVKGLRR